ncbi:MAG: hypothetical protein ABIR16_02375, partial [Dokdonella sp.]
MKPLLVRFRSVVLAVMAIAFSLTVVANAADAPKPTGKQASVEQYPIETFIDTLGVSGASFSADESKILFSSNKSGIWNAYSIPFKGGDWTPITRSTTDNHYAVAYFPGDDRVLVTSDQGGNELNHLFVVDSAGKLKDLTPGEKLKAQFSGFSHDGKQFFVTTNERDPKFFDLYRYDSESYQRELIYKNTDGYFPGTLSPDQKWLALGKTRNTNDSDIYVANLASGKTSKITEHAGNASFDEQDFSA